MSVGRKQEKQFLFIYFLIFISCFCVFPKIVFADAELSSEEAMKLLRSAIYEPTSDSFISTIISPDSDNIDRQAVLMIMKNAVQYKSLNYAFVEIPKDVLIDFLKKGAFLLSLYGVGLEEMIAKLEKESVKEAKKIIEEWLNQNQIKFASGYINQYKFTSYKGNKQEPVFGYNIIFKPKGGTSKISEVFIEFYSPEFIEPEGSRASNLIWGNYWNEDVWVSSKKNRVQPFIVRIKGDVEEIYGGYNWPDNYSLEVIFNEPVPEVHVPTLWEVAKEKIKEKINDYLSNPFFNIDIFKAQISSSLESEYGNSNFNSLEVHSRLDDVLKGLENQCFDNACVLDKNISDKQDHVLDIQEILDNISEKIDILAEEIAELTGNKMDNEEEESDDEDNDDDKKSYGSLESEPNWCVKRQGAVPLMDKIIINEVAWMGTSNSSSNEWIEIKNISDDVVNLQGWQILDKDRQIKIYFELKLEISANGIMLLERTDENSVPYVLANYIYSGALANSNESLEVFDSNCILEDEVVADPNWPAGDSQSKRTMERSKDLTWHDYSGIERDGILGTPKMENSEPKEPVIENKILITEIQTAGKTDPKEEFVELYNPNNKDIELTGWYVQKKTKSGTVSYFDRKNLLFGKKISAKGYFLISRTGYFADLADVSVDAALSDDSALILKNPNEIISDKVGWGEANDYETEPAESSEKPEKGKSLTRKSDSAGYKDSNNNKLDFEKQDPSPKKANQIASNPVWPMFQHDSKHTGRSDFAVSQNLGVVGTYELTSFDSDCFSASNQPVIDSKGVIYYGFGQKNCGTIEDWGKVIAINQDGSKKWESIKLIAPPSYIAIGIDDILYVSAGSNLFALNPDGTEKWHFTADSGISAPTISSDNFVYFTSYSNIYCLDQDGKQIWKNSGVYRGGSASNGPAIGDDGTVYVSWTGFRNMSDEQRGYVFAYRKEDGLVKWQMPLKYEANAPSIGENSDIYVMADDIYSNDSRIYVFDQNGISKNGIYLGHGDLSVPVIDLSGNIIVSDNWSVIAGESWWQPVYQPYSKIKIFDKDGAVLLDLAEQPSSSIANQIFIDSQGVIIFKETLYERQSIDVWSGWWFGQVKSVLTGIDSSSGNKKFQIDLPSNVISNFVLSDRGNIYFTAKEIEDGTAKIVLYNFGPGGEMARPLIKSIISDDPELDEELNLMLSGFDFDLGLEIEEDFDDEEQLFGSDFEFENNTEEPAIIEEPTQQEEPMKQTELEEESNPEISEEIIPEIISETIPEVVLEPIPETPPEAVPEAIPESASESAPEVISESAPEPVPESIPIQEVSP